MPSFSDNEQSCNSHLAALVAINIVTQVLDEAEDILNIAHDSGQPWRYVWRQKKGNGEFYENAEILGVLEVNANNNVRNNCEIYQNDDVIVTSTPQKEIDYVPKSYNENNFIGQGDEDFETRNTDLRSPSMIISCLFDMTDAEQEETIEVFDEVQVNSESRDSPARTVAKLVESCVNLALNTVCGNVSERQVTAANIENSSNSSYSLLTDAVISNDTENENATFYVGTIKPGEDEVECDSKVVTDEELKETTKEDIELYEKTFLTLNRDYDKYSEEEDFRPLRKSMTMQEVELMPDRYSENFCAISEPIHKNFTNTAEASMVLPGAHKNSLVKRCRLQGAKLMSRLRNWWWKQRLIGKRKGCRSGICPLSPQARNLGASLLDHRKLRSPSPTRTAAWKFNTVNEALIHSYNMKDYAMEVNSRDPGEKN